MAGHSRTLGITICFGHVDMVDGAVGSGQTLRSGEERKGQDMPRVLVGLKFQPVLSYGINVKVILQAVKVEHIVR